MRYANGDLTHCFALLFMARQWDGSPKPDLEEVVETDFVALAAPPSPVHGPTSHALALLREFLSSGRFQAR